MTASFRFCAHSAFARKREGCRHGHPVYGSTSDFLHIQRERYDSIARTHFPFSPPRRLLLYLSAIWALLGAPPLSNDIWYALHTRLGVRTIHVNRPRKSRLKYAVHVPGHLRPLCNLAARIVKMEPAIIITLFTTPTFYDKVQSELRRNFEDQEKGSFERIRCAYVCNCLGNGVLISEIGQ